MAATKLLLLLFSVVLLGLSSADVQEEESEEYLEPVPQYTLLEEQDSSDNQGTKSLSRSSGKQRIGGRHKPSGPHGNASPGGPGPRFPLKGQKDGGQKGKQPRDRPFGPPKKEQRDNLVKNKKRKGSGGQ
ncbi:basic salivary proline-rich protein 1-like isoform X2 [Sarcophilus harrisii]|uniref:basic salivary proline-rich protein 1-like isoform X2 n=1 Tax=Sarcophilus harrisii TaxID=9305 RepID=UPI000226D390|nr:basic salivary proline-rich protein 1-like isoform X2 [Sarcophilus harrisii]